MRLAFLALLITGGLTSPVRQAAAQPKQLPPELVAPTDALSPADERKAFTVPAGFDVQLVASEPDIQKPMQMAFDAKGRMWVTTSYHYPFAAEAGKGTDKVFVLSDFDSTTGKAKKVQIFTSDLNIPIGILPLPDCKSVIVSSVGEIRKYKIKETETGPKADGFEVLFTGFGYRDTHGMYNSYTYMPDGWVYACHGFANDSTVKGKDGHEVKMNSGNTFRFRPDGSRLEVYSRGQVNPFGMAVDPWFNLYTADCHSKPMTQIIPSAYYESFGKPHDGLGYGPVMFGYDPGGTGMCGLSWYDADQFPKEYNGMMFLGNVVTNRVHIAKIEWHGATPKAVQQPDLIASTDRWFRPVDIKLGPDGALYIADFYNKIIGHYEVDLKHPARDHDHGRIWRVVWKGKDGKAPAPKFHRADFTAASNKELAQDLFSHPNLTVRFLAGHQLRERKWQSLQEALPKGDQLLDNLDRMVGWVGFIGEAVEDPVALKAFEHFFTVASKLKPEQLTGHAIRAINSREKWGEGERKLLLAAFKSFDSPHQMRAAVEAVIFHPHAEFVRPLIELLKKTPADDTHLKHATRIALRNCLRDVDAWPKEFDAAYADIALAVPNEKAAQYLLAQLDAGKLEGSKVPESAEHIARYGNAENVEELMTSLTQTLKSAPLNADAILAGFKGLQTRGSQLATASVDHILLRSQRQLITADFSPGTVAAELRQILPALKVLAALPAVAPRSPKLMELSRDSRATLTHYITSPKAPTEVRIPAGDVFLRYAPDEALGLLRKQLADTATPEPVRAAFLLTFASSAIKEARLDARDALKDAPYRTAVAVGVALAGTQLGAQDLLDAVKMGKAPARLLQEKAILERLRAANIPKLDQQVAALTKGLPPLDQRLAELIKKRSTAFASAKPDKELGAKLFAKHCAACHKIGEQGGKIAPQLDGIGLRGLERLLEDTLDPNRNVDQAFRARIILTKDEKSITGLMLRVEGEVLVIADGEGKEVRIPTKDIASNRETMLSPMPANFGDVIPEGEFAHLIAYLLDQKTKEPPKKE
jgi:putative heme-binding domain-containing protein